MHATRFDRLIQTLSTTGSRRVALRALVAAAGSALGLAGGQRVSAQTCAATGKRCGGGREPCCSGWCKRKSGSRKKFCRQADNQGVCTVEQSYCEEGVGSFPCGLDDSGNDCLCIVTTTGRSFCGLGGISMDNCGCTSDKGCVTRIGTGAKCVQVIAACGCPNTTAACLMPCPKLN